MRKNEIPRALAPELIQKLGAAQRAVVVYGARQVGKTTLVKKILSQLPYRALEVNADEERFFDVLTSRDARKLKALVEGYDLLFLDEAQRIPDIGINLKILIDNCPDLRIIVTGSSSLELATSISEPLTGRKWTYQLFPIAQLELRQEFNSIELEQMLEDRLVWGSYPDIFNLSGTQDRAKYLRELSSDYLYKDILKLADIRNPEKIRSLLKLLAFQIGQEVSLNELSNSLDLSVETVARYIDLLEQSFVLFKLSGFSRNLRKEVTKSKKYFFYDLGIRNAIIDNFNGLGERNDVGALWESFLISERIKSRSYVQKGGSSYFWRVYTGAEIDYVEDTDGKLSAFEIKYKPRRKIRAPESFQREYPNASWSLITNENWQDFILL